MPMFQVVKREEEVKFNVTAYKTITILVENMGYIGFSKAMSNYDDGRLKFLQFTFWLQLTQEKGSHFGGAG